MIKNKIRINDLKRVFKENALIGILMLLSNVIAVNIITISNYYSADDNLKNFHKKIQFIFESSDGSSALLVTIFATVFPMILAWRMFSFVNKKKNMNVYYSLGISRKDMFTNRFIVASVMMVTSIVVPFIIGTIWNVSVFGSSTALLQSALFLVFRLLACSFFAFAVTTLVISLVGTKVEEFVIAPVFILAITAVSHFASTMEKLFFYGGFQNKFSMLVLGDYSTPMSDSGSLIENLSRFNNFTIINYKVIEKNMIMQKGEAKLPFDLIALLVLLLMVVTLFFFAYRVFMNRKAERTGFFGASSFVNIMFTGIVAVAIASAGGNIYYNNISTGLSQGIGTKTIMAIFVALFLVCYLIIMPVLMRNKKTFIKTIWKLPIFVLVLMIPSTIMVTGGFGVINRIPEVSEIKSATISLPIEMKITGVDFSSTASSPYIELDGRPEFNFLGFTSEKDIEQIRKIHKKLLDIKDESQQRKPPYMKKMYITYQFKDGTFMRRGYYYFNRAVADEWLKIVDSDFLKSEYISAFANTVPMTDQDYEIFKQNYPPNGYLKFSSAVNSPLNGAIIEICNATGKVTDISMNETQTAEFREMVARDLETVPLSKIFFSKRQSVGAIRFLGGEKQSGSNDSFAPKLPIIEEMTNTLDYLEKFEFSKKQDNSEKPVSAMVFELENLLDNKGYYTISGDGYYLFSTRKEIDDYIESLDIKTQYGCDYAVFTAQESIEKLQRVSLRNQFTYNDSYIVLYRYADKTQRAECISYDKMPDELKPV